jgi:hypothetical protein
LASHDTSYLVTPDDIRTYQRDGAVHLRSVLRGEPLARLARALDAVHADPGGRFTRVRGADGAGQTVVGQCSSATNPVLMALIEGGGIARIAAQVMQVRSAQQILDQMFYKEPGRIVPTPWHQDTPFLCVRGMDMARVWISCDASPRAATLQVVRGSHRWNVVYDTRSEAQSRVAMAADQSQFFYDGIGDARLPPAPDVERYRDSFDILGWDVEPGDAIVFQGNVLHGAGGLDHHPHPRRAFATMWGGPDLRYHQSPGATMPTPGAAPGTLPHGARIGDHPEVFPVFWQG